VPSRGTAFPVRLLRVGRRATEHQHRAHQARAGARPDRPKACAKQQEPRAPRARAALAQVAILSSVCSLSLLPSVLALYLSQIGSAASGWRRADPPLVVPLSISARYVQPSAVRKQFPSRSCGFSLGSVRLSVLIVRCTARQCLVPFGGVRCLSKVPAQFPVWQVRISSPVFFFVSSVVCAFVLGFKFHLLRWFSIVSRNLSKYSRHQL